MPNFDGTGPFGGGAMTGGGKGQCSGFSVNSMQGQVTGRGRGYRNRFFLTGLSCRTILNTQSALLSKEEQVNILKRQAQIMTDSINALNQRI